MFVEPIPGDDVHELDVTLRYGDGSSEVGRFEVTKTIDFSSDAGWAQAPDPFGPNTSGCASGCGATV